MTIYRKKQSLTSPDNSITPFTLEPLPAPGISFLTTCAGQHLIFYMINLTDNFPVRAIFHQSEHISKPGVIKH